MSQFTRQIVLHERPSGDPALSNFRVESVALPPPEKGHVQIRNLWMSVDPYMRRRLYEDAGYTSSFVVGQPLDGAAVGKVTATNDPAFPVGTAVLSSLGWREAFNAPASALKKLPNGDLPLEIFLAEAGTTGLTAYVGLMRIADIESNETIFISAAAGAVGLVACQIALSQGCTVIGSAGGREKCEYLNSIGVHRVIDYRAASSLSTALREAAGNGIDVYFDNVGGAHLQAALDVANSFARFVLCGMISQGSGRVGASSPPPSNLLLAITKRIRLQGFIVGDHLAETDAFLAEMSSWISSGKVKPKATTRIGLESAPAALLELFCGGNLGKMLVRLA